MTLFSPENQALLFDIDRLTGFFPVDVTIGGPSEDDVVPDCSVLPLTFQHDDGRQVKSGGHGTTRDEALREAILQAVPEIILGPWLRLA
jgi:hypothetical protein